MPTMTPEQAAEARRQGLVRRNALLNGAKAWTLADRYEGIMSRMPQAFRQSNSVTRAVLAILYKDHLKYGVDTEGNRFPGAAGSPERLDAEVAFIRQYADYGLKLQAKHAKHLGIELPKKASGRIDYKGLSAETLDEIKPYLSEEEYEGMLADLTKPEKDVSEAA